MELPTTRLSGTLGYLWNSKQLRLVYSLLGCYRRLRDTFPQVGLDVAIFDLVIEATVENLGMTGRSFSRRYTSLLPTYLFRRWSR